MFPSSRRKSCRSNPKNKQSQEYVHTHIHMYTYTCMYIYMYIYMLYVCEYVYIHMYMYICNIHTLNTQQPTILKWRIACVCLFALRACLGLWYSLIPLVASVLFVFFQQLVVSTTNARGYIKVIPAQVEIPHRADSYTLLAISYRQSPWLLGVSSFEHNV